jgi:MinD superfamily P-loop ATPase
MYIAVASGKGGTGKTLVSTTLALCAGDCSYVDLDVEEPNGFIFLQPEIEKEIRFTLRIPEIDEAVCTFCEKCAAACAYVCPTPGALKEVDKEIGRIRIGRKGKIKFIEGRLNVGRPSGVPLIGGIINDYLNMDDLLFVDASPGTSCPVVESLKKSDYVILVTEPTPFGLNDLKLTVEIVKELGKKTGIIVNKDMGGRSGIDDFSEEVHIPILLKIPYSLDIQKAYSRGIPLLESLPGIKEKFTALLNRVFEKK